MYKINDDSMKSLQTLYSWIDQLEVKGVTNCIIMSNIANLLQHFYDEAEKVDDTVKSSNLPVVKKGEKPDE